MRFLTFYMCIYPFYFLIHEQDCRALDSVPYSTLQEQSFHWRPRALGHSLGQPDTSRLYIYVYLMYCLYLFCEMGKINMSTIY